MGISILESSISRHDARWFIDDATNEWTLFTVAIPPAARYFERVKFRIYEGASKYEKSYIR